VESVALDILRSIEDRLITDGVMPLAATTAVEVALYILNQKRAHLKDIEARYLVPITVTADKEMHISQYVIERGAEGSYINGDSAVVQMDWAHHREDGAAPAAESTGDSEVEGEGEQAKRRSRRRRRGRRGEGGADAERPAAVARNGDAAAHDAASEDMAEEAGEAGAEANGESGGETPARRSPRRRGRRGGRRGRSGQRPQTEAGADSEHQAESNGGPAENVAAETHEDRPNGKDNGSKPHTDESVGEAAVPEPRKPEPVFSVAAAREEEPLPTPAPNADSEAAEEPASRRRGWWSRG
jgi:ribonuclease E